MVDLVGQVGLFDEDVVVGLVAVEALLDENMHFWLVVDLLRLVR